MEGEMDIKVNFSGRAIRYTEEEIAVVVEAMRNADPLTQGQYMRAFESKFARYQGVAEGSCFTTMNGCAALEMSGPATSWSFPRTPSRLQPIPILKRARAWSGPMWTRTPAWSRPRASKKF